MDPDASYQPPISEFPSRAQMALAIHIYKSKPDSLSVEEWILAIRASLQSTPSSGGAIFHLDNAAIWKHLFSKSRAGQRELERQITQMQKQQSDRSEPAQKARYLEESLSPINKAPEHQSTFSPNEAAAASLHHSLDSLSLEFAIFKALIDVTPLVFHLGILHSLMNSGKPDEKQLLSSLLSILSLTKNLISEICNSACSRDDGVIVFTCQRKVNQTPSSLHAAETQRVVLSLCRVLSYLSKGLDYIGSPSDVLITDHPVTQGFLLLFSKIMSQIAELSPITELDQDPRISLSNADITDKPNSRNSIVKFADDSRVGLSQLLLTMIAATAGKATPHKLLFEGYISILLNRIGNLLSFSVFNGGNPESLGDDSNDPLNQQMPSDAKNSTNGERYYLIWILERALCFMSGMMDGLASNSPTGIKFASKASRLKSSSQVKQILPEKTKARLQNTLLKSIFKDNENDFLNSLNISAGPPPLADADDVTKCRKTPYALGSQDWFQEMLWKLLGWEILSSNIEHWMANDSSETESD